MSIKEELPECLYNIFEKRNLLHVIEDITNSENVIAIDIIDLDQFKNYKYVDSFEFSNKEDLPLIYVDITKIIVCFTCHIKVSLKEIADFIEMISKKYDIKEIIFGAKLDSSLANDTLIAKCIFFKDK